jgi:uncharacterized membrane protein (UPF0127 family)
MRSGWLLRDGDVICALEMADSSRERSKGLRGRPGCEGALHLPRARSVHTFAMKFPIDVAFLTDELIVLRLVTMPPWRLTFPRRGVHSVLEAEAGSWERWGVKVGDQLVIRAVE